MGMTSYMGVFLAAAALAIVPVSCSRDEDMGYDGPVAAQVSAGIEGADTKAQEGEWSGYDKIGISTFGNTRTEYSNMQYVTVNADGKFTPVTQSDCIFFLDDDETVTFRAYYPFSGTSGTPAGVIKNSTETQDYRTDYLFAESTAGKNDPELNFTFSHAMTRLVLILKTSSDSGGITVGDLNAGRYYLSGIRHEGTFNTLTGEAKADISSAPVNDWEITVTPFNSASAPGYRIILYPQSVEKLTFTAEVAGQTFTCDLTPPLEAGKSYTYNITIKRTSAEASSENIASWPDGEVENGGSVEATEPEP